MKTRDFLGFEWTIDCMGCAISNGSMHVPGGIIQKTASFCIHQDPLIPLPGFLVIAALKHIRSLFEMQDDQYREFSHLLRTVHTAIKTVTGIEHLTLVQEESSAHFHLWFFPWTATILEQYGRPSLSSIRVIMSDLRQNPINESDWIELQKSIAGIRLFLQNT